MDKVSDNFHSARESCDFLGRTDLGDPRLRFKQWAEPLGEETGWRRPLGTCGISARGSEAREDSLTTYIYIYNIIYIYIYIFIYLFIYLYSFIYLPGSV